MKSLYESILDVDDTELDDASRKLLFSQLELHVEGTGANTYVDSMVIMKENAAGELCPWSSGMNSEDIPSLIELFPQGCTISRALFAAELRYKHLNKHKLSELAKHKIYIHHFDLDSKDCLDALDTKVDVVELTCQYGDVHLNNSTFKRISKYADAAIVDYLGPGSGVDYKKLINMQDCPLSILAIKGGMKMFGMKNFISSGFRKIPAFMKDNSDPQAEGYPVIDKIKTWMKNNPKTSLLTTVSTYDVWYEKIRYNSKGELTSTDKFTPNEQYILR